MGTRGLTAVYFNGQFKIAQYGQWDHYPDGQGAVVLDFCTRHLATPAGRASFCDALGRVSFHPGPEASLADYPLMDRGVGAEILDAVLESTNDIVLWNSIDFANDSLFCEWAYSIDLDALTLEVYRGFQKQPHHWGRFSDNPSVVDGYYPVALIARFSLTDLPDEDTFVKTCHKE